jgi:hypothetical protein
MFRGDKFSSMRADVPPLIGHTTVSSAAITMGFTR